MDMLSVWWLAESWKGVADIVQVCGKMKCVLKQRFAFKV
jgi:hypothetical protein